VGLKSRREESWKKAFNASPAANCGSKFRALTMPISNSDAVISRPSRALCQHQINTGLSDEVCYGTYMNPWFANVLSNGQGLREAFLTALAGIQGCDASEGNSLSKFLSWGIG
jgi:hypothetical protein